MRALWLPTALDRFEVQWAPVNGWETRGVDTFDPRGGVDHHTAGPLTGDCPSLGIVTNGRSDLPGPLSETLQARSNLVYIVASGKANHAGLGDWNGLTGNSRMWGNERENVGTSAEPWRMDQHNTAARLHAAWIWGMHEFEGVDIDPANVCEHKEWAPTRKVDVHTYLGTQLRADIAAVLAGQDPQPELPNPLPSMEEDMILIEYSGAHYLLIGGRLIHCATQPDIDALLWGAGAVGRPIQQWSVSADQWKRLVAMFGRAWTADASQPASSVVLQNGWPTAPRVEV